jgi:hypothetical protein
MRACSTTHSLGLLWSLFLLLACPSTKVGPAGADAGAPAPISEVEWSALTAPRVGVHEVWSEACNGVRIGQEYRVVPTVGCYPRPSTYPPTTDTRDCRLDDYCETSADCTVQPGGICRGSADSHCMYAGLEEQPCDEDAECVQLPGGSCRPRIAGGESSCYPTGECRRTPLHSCWYPSVYSQCQGDAECTAAPGGYCARSIRTSCVYNECDDACGPNARCECQYVRTCVPADCFSDAECGAGFRCEGTLDVQCGNLYPPVGYHCHTARDECQSDAECGMGNCVFDPALSAWSCRTLNCLTR